MQVVRRVDEIELIIKKIKLQGKTVGFVPTMGFLHEGHFSLVRESKTKCDITVVSIFVNPLQFGVGEDFDVYPRDEAKDLKNLENLETDIVFLPDKKDFYPKGFSTFVEVEKFSNVMCGKSRPGHFRGVATVVLKLLNIVCPDKLFLGQKDAQQVFIINRMVKDLDLSVDVCICPIVREEDGLALSSRNIFLSGAERKDAVVIYKSLTSVKALIDSGEKKASLIKNKIVEQLRSVSSLKVDYVEIVDFDSLEELDDVVKGNTLIAIAVYLGKTRLIDNFIV